MTEITQADCDVAEYIAGDRARDLDYQVVARHRQCGYDQGYYDGRQADGAEERAKIVAWLRENASAVHGFYHDCYVMGDGVSPELTQARLWLCEAARVGLVSGLDLVGVSAPDSM